MFEKAGGDSLTANSKLYAKDLRHVVMLNGFALQESTVSQPPIPSVPIPTVPSSPPGLSPSQQPTLRPAVNPSSVVRPPQLPQNPPQQRPPFGMFLFGTGLENFINFLHHIIL